MEDSSSRFQPTAKDTKYSTSIFIAGDDTNQAEHQGITYDNIILDLGDTIESVGNVIELADRLQKVAILKNQQKDVGINNEIDVDQSSITITKLTEPFIMKEDSESITAPQYLISSVAVYVLNSIDAIISEEDNGSLRSMKADDNNKPSETLIIYPSSEDPVSLHAITDDQPMASFLLGLSI